MSRIAVVERNILRLGIHELQARRGAAQGGHRRGGAAGALVRRRARARLRERGARRHRPRASDAVNILLVNWQDRENPQAGGAEIHLFEIFGRLAARGHRVRLVCSGWRGAASPDPARRHRGPAHRRPAQLRAAGARRGAARAAGGAPRHRGRGHQQAPAVPGRDDRASVLRDRPPSVRRDGVPGGARGRWPPRSGWRSGRCRAAYRRAGFHAISESTRDDLVARGVARRADPGDPSGGGHRSLHARARRAAVRPRRPSCTLDG